jgi:hypothetical protein
MAIKCANCKEHHETVQEVRACFGYPQEQEQEQTQTGPIPEAPITSKQLPFLTSLMKQERVTLKDAEPKNVSKRTASVLIRNLTDRRDARVLRGGSIPALHPDFISVQGEQEKLDSLTSLPDIPDGHYAIPSLTGNNDLDFFRVDRPEEGQWAGRIFLKRVIGGKPDQNVRGKTIRAALEAIADAGIEKSRELYGREIGRCWRCNRHLTDELSRQRGIGPDCYAIVYGGTQ